MLLLAGVTRRPRFPSDSSLTEPGRRSRRWLCRPGIDRKVVAIVQIRQYFSKYSATGQSHDRRLPLSRDWRHRYREDPGRRPLRADKVCCCRVERRMVDRAADRSGSNRLTRGRALRRMTDPPHFGGKAGRRTPHSTQCVRDANHAGSSRNRSRPRQPGRAPS